MMKPRRTDNGNALAELVLLLPLYVLILLGMLFIGDLTGIRTKLQPTAEQSAVRPGGVSASVLQQQEFSLYAGGTLEIEKDEPEEYPPAGELARIMEYLADPPATVRAHGYWEFQNGRLVPVVSVSTYHRNAELTDWHLDDNEPYLLEETLRGYMHETSARARFSYYPDYIRVYPFELYKSRTGGGDENFPGELEAEHRAFARGTLERSVEASGRNHPIDGIIEMMPEGGPMPDYPNFMSTYLRDLWLPDGGLKR